MNSSTHHPLGCRRGVLGTIALMGLVIGALIFSVGASPVLAQATTSGPQTMLESLAWPRSAETRRESSAHPDLSKNGDARPIEPGETLVLGELEGPGMITHMWCTVAGHDPFIGRSLVLRIYWEGADEPSVEAPLGDFFGVGHGAYADFTSLPVATSSHGRARNCYWPMPFRHSAKVTVTNESQEHRVGSFYYYLDWEQRPIEQEPLLYFHAQYRQEMPAQPGDYTILETDGRGHYVGTVLSAQLVHTGWFGEGDDRFYIDGESEPRLSGTGTEDYFNDAWGFRQFSTPMYGVSLWEGYFPGDRLTAYRWHLTDPVVFNKSLRVTIEHKGSLFNDQGLQTASFVERPDWFSSVAFWYQTPAVGPRTELPPAEKRVAPYRILPIGDLTVRREPKGLVMRQETGLMYAPREPDAKLEIDFDIEEPGRYQLTAVLFHSVFGSRYQPLLNDEPLGPELDLCISGADPIPVRFDLHDLKPGTHTLRFEGRGPSPNRRTMAPEFYAIGLHSIWLLRLEDMEGYGQATN